MSIKTGVAGVGAIGGIVCEALAEGRIEGMELVAVAESRGQTRFDVPHMDFPALAAAADIIVEALPPDIVPLLAKEVLSRGKTLVLISSAALLRFPEIRQMAETGAGRIMVPSGSLGGVDAVRGLYSMGIEKAVIRSTKPPRAYEGAPYIVEKSIDLGAITQKQLLFSGKASDVARAFPANTNVAVTFSLAGRGPEETEVEVWADPAATGNSHEITVESAFSRLNARIDNRPSPDNPKTSLLAAHSIIACLRQMTAKIAVY